MGFDQSGRILGGWTSRSFQYHPLESADTIRVLIVHPASDFQAPLVTELIHAPRRYNIGNQPFPIFQDYTAVSYHWGPPVFASSICCNDSTLRVTLHVEHMLRRLRKTKEPRRLWIDAICLNQSDAAEKSVQIQNMRQIYEEAKKVIIWLGEPMPATHDSHPQVPSQAQNAQARGVALNVIASLRYLKITGEVSDDQLGRSLDDFLNNPWFKRRWIVQEATAHGHTTILYGDQKIAWPELALCVDRLRLDKAIISTQGAVDRIRKMKSPPTDILDAIYTYRAFECGDTRDVIAALQGLAVFQPDDTLQAWRVDYQKSWTQNFVSFARTAIFAGHSDRIFYHLRKMGTLRGVCNEPIPIWVPAWASGTAAPRNWRPNGHAISLHCTFEVRQLVQQHLALIIDRPLPKLTRGFPELNADTFELLTGQTLSAVCWIDHDGIYGMSEEDMQSFSKIESLFRSLVGNTFFKVADFRVLLMSAIPMECLAVKYLNRTPDKDRAMQRFESVLSTWLEAMATGPIEKFPGSGPSQDWRPLNLARTSTYPSRISTDERVPPAFELDLLDWGILNDCIYAALRALLSTHVFIECYTMVGIAPRSISSRDCGILRPKEWSSLTKCRLVYRDLSRRKLHHLYTIAAEQALVCFN